MALDLSNKVIKFLEQNPEQKHTAKDIATWILKTYPNECRQKQERSDVINSEQELFLQIVREIGSCRLDLSKKNPKIKTTEGRPRKYYYTESPDSLEIEQIEGKPPKTEEIEKYPKKEYHLYPILAEFLKSELNVYSRRIDEKRSCNSHGSGGNRWLYPDLVGIEDFSQDWIREIKDCVQQYSDKKTKLWSFEVKIRINRSNVREVFFQTVSNSSWANLGYLVANDEIDGHTLKELRILSELHGIGLIYLDIENPSESQIMIPAQEKLSVDWHTANRLAEENTDFLSYVKAIRQFYQTGEIHHLIEELKS